MFYSISFKNVADVIIMRSVEETFQFMRSSQR